MYEFETLRDAMVYLRNRLEPIVAETYYSRFHLIYCKGYDDEFYVFENNNEVEDWLEDKYVKWELYEYHDLDTFFEEECIIWKFHPSSEVGKYKHLYKESKSFTKEWSRKRIKNVEVTLVPQVSLYQ